LTFLIWVSLSLTHWVSVRTGVQFGALREQVECSVEALGLQADELKGVQLEHTHAVPGLTGSRCDPWDPEKLR
jgi:hypothetical protein